MPDESESSSGKEKSADAEVFSVVISMRITDPSGKVDSKEIDFGKLKLDQVKGLADLFSMMASNIEYIKRLEPQYEKLGKSKPPYLH